MKKCTVMAAFAVAAVLGTAGVAGTMPVVSGVTMTQRANSRLVDIDYTLTGEAAIVTLGIETNGVPLPDSAVTWLYKDVCKLVQTGTHSIVWDAGKDWPEHSVTNAKACVTAWVTNSPPQVMVIDLRKGTSATSENPYPVYYYTSAEAVPKGVTDDLYKMDRILMQRLSPTGPTGFAMGDESKPSECVDVGLTQAFYVGVYQVTQEQWKKVMGTEPSGNKNLVHPVNRVSYDDIRGTLAHGGGGWPTNDSVYAESFMGRLRTKTTLAGFDLPTDAQWEYACRAGTRTYYNDGIDGSATSQLDDLGWWTGNSGGVTHTVGQKKPNDWGLYDMHGNVNEWCLDWYAESLSGGMDPAGAVSGSDRIFRGGGWSYPASSCRSSIRHDYPSSTKYGNVGFRLVRTLP